MITAFDLDARLYNASSGDRPDSRSPTRQLSSASRSLSKKLLIAIEKVSAEAIKQAPC